MSDRVFERIILTWRPWWRISEGLLRLALRNVGTNWQIPPDCHWKEEQPISFAKKVVVKPR